MPGTKKNEIYDYDKVKTITDYTSNDDGETYHKKFTYPESLDSKRLQIRYAEDKGPDGITGIEKDGIIELRRGVQDLSLGAVSYTHLDVYKRQVLLMSSFILMRGNHSLLWQIELEHI